MMCWRRLAAGVSALSCGLSSARRLLCRQRSARLLATEQEQIRSIDSRLLAGVVAAEVELADCDMCTGRLGLGGM